jgi:hypothetical protein
MDLVASIAGSSAPSRFLLEIRLQIPGSWITHWIGIGIDCFPHRDESIAFLSSRRGDSFPECEGGCT